MELMSPARELVDNLGDLEFGNQHPMLLADRKPKGGRPPITTPSEMLREDVAVAVSILMDGGMEERLANQHVARKLDSIGLKVSPETVGNWRSQVMAHLPGGVGRPGKRDEHRTALPPSNEVWQYLDWWSKWRDWAKPHSAKQFVDKAVLPEMKRLHERTK